MSIERRAAATMQIGQHGEHREQSKGSCRNHSEHDRHRDSDLPYRIQDIVSILGDAVTTSHSSAAQAVYESSLPLARVRNYAGKRL